MASQKKIVLSRLLTEAITNLVLPLAQGVYPILGCSVVFHYCLVEPVRLYINYLYKNTSCSRRNWHTDSQVTSGIA
jgi:hypothetical protein